MAIIRTVLLMGVLTGILLAIGYFWAGIAGMALFLMISVLLNFATYWWSDKIVLKMYRAKQISEKDNPELHKIVAKVAKEAGIPKPKVYLVNLPVPNAFATGRSPKRAAVAVTSGILKALDNDELEGVLAHEISHVKNRDTLTSAVAASVAGAISFIAQIAWFSIFAGENRNGGSAILFPLIILAPFAAMLVQLAISRTREYAADKSGAIITKNPLSLASALEKISAVAKQHPLKGNSATSHLFIVNPFSAGAMTNLFSTHPPTEERIQRLKELAKEL